MCKASSFRRFIGWWLLIAAAVMATPEQTGLLGIARGQGAAKAPAPSKSASPTKSAAPAKPAVQPQPAATDARSEDRNAIQAALTSFAKAFEAADAKSLAGHWTADGEYKNESGVELRGRDALETRFAAFFASAPDAKAEVHPDSLRFLSADSAIADGTVAVRRAPAEPAKRARYTAFFVRDGGQWKMAQMRESDFDATTIEDLAWLIGEWKSASGEGAEIRTTYSWDASKKFIHVKFTIQEQTLGFGGTQIIGVDPASGQLHSWTFEANGGVGEADWQPDGDHWVLEAEGTLADGRTLIETNVLRRINNDTISWQSVDRTLDDVEVPDLAPVKVTRVNHNP